MNTQNSHKPTTEEQSLCTENWKRVHGRVAEACTKAGRELASVRVVGVTKYVDMARTMALYNAGCHDLGESRAQAFWEKAALFADNDVWCTLAYDWPFAAEQSGKDDIVQSRFSYD